jgi:hypothetical protein
MLSLDWNINKSADPDGFNVGFYQKFWPLDHSNLFDLVSDFYEKKLKIDRLNYGVITLVPKKWTRIESKTIEPFALLTVIFKIIIKWWLTD